MVMLNRTIGMLLLLLPFLGRANAGNDSLLHLLRQPQHDTVKATILNQLAREMRNVDAKAAENYALESFRLSKNISYSRGVASAADKLGVIYLNQANYKLALYYLFTSLKLNEAENNEKWIASNCNNIGSVYFQLKKYDMALIFYKRALLLKLKLGLIKEMSSTYINIGNIYMQQEELDLCIVYYNKALKNAKNNNDDYNVSIALMNLGEAYIDKKEYDNALKYYINALAINTKRKDVLHLSNCNYSIGKIYLSQKKYDQAEAYLLKGMQLSESGGGRLVRLNTLKHLAQLYEEKSKAGMALAYYKKYHALSDSIFNIESSEKISEVQTKYETEKKDKAIAVLNNDKAITEATISREKLIRNFFIAGFFLITIIAGVLTRNIFLKQRVNKILEDKNKEIERQRREIEWQNEKLTNYNKELRKENISARYEILKTKINPHFLFNSLSTLSSLIIQDPGQAIDFVSHFARLYRNILELGNKELITIEEEMRFVEEYIFLQKMRFNENLIFTSHIHKSLFEEFIPPFAIQLLIENAIKHNVISNEYKLGIKIYSEKDSLIVVNTFQPKEQHEDSTGIGQKNITDRYKLVTSDLPHFKIDEGRYMAYLPIIKSIVTV